MKYKSSIPFHDVLVKNEIYFVGKEIKFVINDFVFIINEIIIFPNETNFVTYEIYVFTNEKYFVMGEFYLSILRLILVLCEKIVDNNYIIIFKSEIAFLRMKLIWQYIH